MKRCLVIFTMLTASFNLFAQSKQSLKQMRDYFKGLTGGPYVFMQSPRTDFEVGMIYQFINGRFYRFSTTAECFGSPTNILSAQVQSFQVNKTLEASWKVGLEILAMGPITEDVKLNLEAKNISKISISIGNLTSRSMSLLKLKALLKDNNVDQLCRQSELVKGDTKYIVTEVLMSDSLEIEFSDSNNNKIDISAEFIKKILPNVQIDRTKISNGKLAITKTQFVIAYKPIRIKTLEKNSADGLILEFDPDNLQALDAYYNQISQ